MIKLDKFFENKKNTTLIYLLLAMGVLLVILGNTTKPASRGNDEPAVMSRTREAELILSEIKGAGRVSVMISQGDNAESSMFSEDAPSEYNECSVLIVADGGADSRVREKIIKAASAALGVNSHKIQVFERKE